MTHEFDESSIWDIPYATPMVEQGFQFTTEVIAGGHPGGVIYAPTRTGKTSFIEAVVDDVKSFQGLRGNTIQSASAYIITDDRMVTSEGGFWEWLLREFNHACAGKRTHSPTSGAWCTPMSKVWRARWPPDAWCCLSTKPSN